MTTLQSSKKVISLGSFGDFQSRFKRHQQAQADRILVRRCGVEGLFLVLDDKKTVYVVHAAGLVCPSNVTSAFANRVSSVGEVDDYRWKVITGGPCAQTLIRYVNHGTPLWRTL